MNDMMTHPAMPSLSTGTQQQPESPLEDYYRLGYQLATATGDVALAYEIGRMHGQRDESDRQARALRTMRTFAP